MPGDAAEAPDQGAEQVPSLVRPPKEGRPRELAHHQLSAALVPDAKTTLAGEKPAPAGALGVASSASPVVSSHCCAEKAARDDRCFAFKQNA